jgi:membrane protein
MLLIVAKGLQEERISSRASALTYFSLLAFVPVLAILFGIFKGFGIEKYLEKLIYANFSFQKEVIDQIVLTAKRALESASGEIIAGIGLIILLWAVIRVLSVIEQTFNDIWQVKKSRGMARKFSDYFALLLLAPMMMILASSSTVYLTTRISTLTGRSEFVEYVGDVALFLLQLAPYVLIWILLTILYMVIPNTRVKFKSALLAGIVAGTLFQVVQWIYIRFQIGVTSYNAIYGSFAALPLFLLWLQTSWYIVLLGAEISYANQNVEKFDYEMGHSTISHSYSRLLSLLIAHRIIRNFVEGKKPMSINEIAHALDIPVRIASTLTYELAECGIFSETYTSEYKERAYQPARDINTMTVQSIVEILDRKGEDHIPVPLSKEYARLKEATAAFRHDLENHPENVLLKDL